MKPSSFFQRSELAATLWTFRREFAVCVVFTVVVNLLMLTPTLYMLQVFDRVMISQSIMTLAALTLVMLFLYAVMAFAEWSRSRLLVRLGVKLDAQLNSRVFKASFESYLKQLGRSPGQAFSDLTNVRQFMTGNGLFAFMDAPWTPIYLFVLFMLHPWLGVIGVVFSVILVALAWFSNRATKAPLEEAMEAGAQASNFVNNKLRNAELIESMGMLGDFRRLWQVRHQHYLTLNARASDVSSRVQALIKFMRYCQQSLALGAGALLVINGELSSGAMIAANVLMGRATQPLDLMVSTWKSFLSARQAFRRLENLLDEYPGRSTGLVHAAPQGNMKIEDLVATAPMRARPILKGLNAEFPAGQVIGVIGPSGSGKSTLARALVGIWPYTEGKVWLDDTILSEWERDELGPYLGYLPQDIELFEGSIAENVGRFGDLEPEKVIRACQRAGVHDMILRFPRGYDTPMGEAGSLLSGGQRQRIGLARAMYGDPKVVVLDEPNSNLDDGGEAALVKAVLDLKQQGSMVLLITHRTNILGIVDRLMLLQDGEIKLYGPRDAVIAALQPQPAPAPAAAPATSAQPA
jgi:ATP-binding cassette subfamily C exporter for protease/lipase